MRLAIIGATGLVGQEVLEVLEERKIDVAELIPVASTRSVGNEIHFNGNNIKLRSIDDALETVPDFAIFSAGAAVSRKYAPAFAEGGTRVIDNSSAWRMDPDIKLIVPEINISEVEESDMIIANPNCSTIQLVVAIDPLHRKYGIRRIVISTYQSFTGTGAKAVAQYESERNGINNPLLENAYPHPIFENCLPHCDVFLDNDYTKEEMKLVHETRKIMSVPELPVTATAVRVPVHGGHSESVNLEFERQFDLEELRQVLAAAPGVVVRDDIKKNEYPMPIYARKEDDVYVGRIRRDESVDKGVNLWIVADNLRKGAATNAVQILEHLMN